MKFRAVLLAVACLWCGTIQAGPLDLRQVSADAKWLVHLDVDAMRQSSLMEKAYLAGSQQWAQLESWLSTACEELKLDPRVDLHSITLFGTSLGKLQGIALIHAEMQPGLMVARAKEEDGYRSSTYGRRDIHSWTDGRHTVAGAFYTPSLLVVARSEGEVEQALDVLDGKRERLTGKPRPVAGLGAEGSMLTAWTEGLSDSALPLRSPAIRKAEALGLVVGEKAEEVFVGARLMMQTAATAENVRAVLEGVRSAAELQYEGDPAIMSVVKKVKLTVSEKTVNVELRAAAEDVWLQAKALFARLAPTH
jgi:hypothetical protein